MVITTLGRQQTTTRRVQVEIDKLNERVAWLERKMVRVLWLLVSVTSAFAGFIVAYNIDNSLGWPSILIAIVVVLKRIRMRGDDCAGIVVGFVWLAISSSIHQLASLLQRVATAVGLLGLISATYANEDEPRATSY